MTHRIGILLLASTAMIASAAAQNAPNPAQAAAKELLQAADKAIGASKVKSYVISASGWMGYPGQQFAEGDLPRTDLKSYVRTVDYDSKSAKTDWAPFAVRFLALERGCTRACPWPVNRPHPPCRH